MSRLKLKFLGGAKEVGRSSIYVQSKDTRLLLDYGVMLNDEPRFPQPISSKSLDAVILTHSHLDHSGGIPLLYISGEPRMIGTDMTFKLSNLLLHDFLKLSSSYLPFEKEEVKKALSYREECFFREIKKVKDVEIELIDAGHIPGSTMVIVNGDKRILYTGDFTTIKSKLLEGADTDVTDVDAVIIESTYATEDHPDRGELENMFVSKVRECSKEGGVVLVPAFSVGRAQEIMCILFSHGLKGPVYLDGMAIKALEYFIEGKEFIDGYNTLLKAAKKVKKVRSKNDRLEALDQPSVIIAPAGMLKGGPAAFYMRYLVEDPRSAVFLVSFQLPGTPGAMLLEEGKYTVDGNVKDVKSKVGQYRFSSHAGRKQLQDFLKLFDAGTKVFAVHGEKDRCEALAKWASKELNLDAFAPVNGDIFDI